MVQFLAEPSASKRHCVGPSARMVSESLRRFCRQFLSRNERRSNIRPRTASGCHCCLRARALRRQTCRGSRYNQVLGRGGAEPGCGDDQRAISEQHLFRCRAQPRQNCQCAEHPAGTAIHRRRVEHHQPDDRANYLCAEVSLGFGAGSLGEDTTSANAGPRGIPETFGLGDINQTFYFSPAAPSDSSGAWGRRSTCRQPPQASSAPEAQRRAQRRSG